MSDTESFDYDGTSRLRHQSRDDEAELRAEIEKEDREIEILRAKAEERRLRQEEEHRKQEEERARLESERRAREEEEKKRREEAAQKKKQLELEKLEAEKQKIKTDMVSLETGGSKLSNVLKAKEDMQKSPEQLEREKREIISSRLVELDLDGSSKSDLVSQAAKFHEILRNLHSQIYDLTEKHERQRYDMMELAERARQIEKGKSKTRKSNIVHTGLGGSVFPWIQEQCAQAPQKLSLFSRYERVTDRRTYKDRRDLWAAPPAPKEIVLEKPKAKIKQVEEVVKPRSRSKKSAAPEEAPPKKKEEHKEEPAPEEHAEEAPSEE